MKSLKYWGELKKWTGMNWTTISPRKSTNNNKKWTGSFVRLDCGLESRREDDDDNLEIEKRVESNCAVLTTATASRKEKGGNFGNAFQGIVYNCLPSAPTHHFLFVGLLVGLLLHSVLVADSTQLFDKEMTKLNCGQTRRDCVSFHFVRCGLRYE